MDELTDNEKQMLAREVAADKWSNPTGYTPYWNLRRQAFAAGWDAAMEYVNAKKLEQSAESDRLRPEPTT